MPKPEIQILVCTNSRPPGASKPCCEPKDAMEVYRRFKDRVRSHDLRDRVMVVRTGCLKHCSQGLTINLWPMNFWYRNVTLEDVEEILTESVIGGREVERLSMPDIPWE